MRTFRVEKAEKSRLAARDPSAAVGMTAKKKGRKRASMRWLARIERRAPKLSAWWELAAQPQGWIIGAG